MMHWSLCNRLKSFVIQGDLRLRHGPAAMWAKPFQQVEMMQQALKAVLASAEALSATPIAGSMSHPLSLLQQSALRFQHPEVSHSRSCQPSTKQLATAWQLV